MIRSVSSPINVKALLLTSTKTFGQLFILGIMLLSFSTASAQYLWSEPSSWPGGIVPEANDNVIIPAGQEIILDVSPPTLNSIIIQGKLKFAEVPIVLKSGWIMVLGGTLEIGTETEPHVSKATITLTGIDEDVLGMGVGSKFIVVNAGGKLELHGIRKDDVSWTVLSQTAFPGQTQIDTDIPTNWKVGDRIVIAASGIDPEHAEEVQITGISGTTIDFTPALTYEHYGFQETYNGKTVDMRAEVGLLTRTIKIQGNAASDGPQFGGHIMVMSGSGAKVEGVELYRMGQRGRVARYPFHWHLAGPRYGDYFRNNSIHLSYHRAVITHGTNGALVENNTVYDVNSHMFVVAEDGDEKDNIYRNNLGILGRRLNATYFAFPDGTPAGSLQSEDRPGIFWMVSPQNYIINNRAAGCRNGNGYFYDGIGLATKIPDDFFTGNIAHSNSEEFFEYINDRYPPKTRGYGLFIRDDNIPGHKYLFKDFTAYKNELGGVWMEHKDQILDNSILASNGAGVMLMRSSVTNTVIVGETNNNITPSEEDYGAFNCITAFAGKKEFYAENVHLENIHSAVILYDDSVVPPRNQLINITKTNVTADPVVFSNDDVIYGAIPDEDGSLTGIAESLIFGGDYAYALPDCTPDVPTNTITCDANNFTLLTLSSEAGGSRPIDQVKLTHEVMGPLNMHSYEFPNRRNYQYSYIPRNARYQLEFEDVTDIPLQFFMELESKVTSFGGYRIPYIPGSSAYLIDEFDNIIPPAASFDELNFGETNYWVDVPNGLLYVILRTKVEKNFKEKVMVLRTNPYRVGNVESALAATLTPNPVVDETTFQVYLEGGNSNVAVEIFDVNGQKVDELSFFSEAEGMQTFKYDASDLAAGTYLYRIINGSKIASGKLIRID